MTISSHRTAALAIPLIAVSLSFAAIAVPANAVSSRHHAPAPRPTASAPATAAPAPAPAPPTIAVTDILTQLGSTFSAGGYSLQTYNIDVAAAGRFFVKYSVDFGGGQIRTYLDGTEVGQLTGVGTDGNGISGSFILSAGKHTIGSYSPDGYGQTDIVLIRAN